MNIRPPSVKESWDDCDVWTQACILAYEQLRSHEENDVPKSPTTSNRSNRKRRR